jgi:hypothetical protein
MYGVGSPRVSRERDIRKSSKRLAGSFRSNWIGPHSGRPQAGARRLGRCFVGGEVEVEKDLFHRRLVAADLVIAGHSLFGRLLGHAFQSLQRRFAGEPGDISPARLERVGEQGEDRIVAQLVMVVEILIAERHPVDALGR